PRAIEGKTHVDFNQTQVITSHVNTAADHGNHARCGGCVLVGSWLPNTRLGLSYAAWMGGIAYVVHMMPGISVTDINQMADYRHAAQGRGPVDDDVRTPGAEGGDLESVQIARPGGETGGARSGDKRQQTCPLLKHASAWPRGAIIQSTSCFHPMRRP